MLRSFATVGLLQLLTMLVLLVRTKALALLLGPEYVGAMSVTDKLLAVIVQGVSVSMPFAAVRFLPAAWASGTEAYASLLRRMRNLLVLTTTLALVATVLVTLTMPRLWGAQLLPYRGAVLWAAIGMPVLVFVPFIQSAIAGRMREGRSMGFTLAHAAVFAASAVIGAAWRGLVGVYMVYAVLGLIVVGLGMRTAMRGTKPPAGENPFSIRLPRQMWRFSGALITVTVVMPYAALSVQYSVLSHYGAITAGWMQAAVGISLSVRALLGSAHSVFLTPNVNRLDTPEARLAWANQFQRTLCLITIAAVPMLLLFGGLAVDILYSRAFSEGAQYVVYFVLAEVVMLISGTYQSLIIALDHMGFHVVQNLTAQALLAGVSLVLIPRIGIAGAGLGALAAPVFLYGTTTAFLHWKHGLVIPREIRILGALTLLALTIAGAVGSTFTQFDLPTVALKLAIYAVAVAVGAMFVTAEERRRLLALVPRVLRLRARPVA